jgi:ADP-heptose:LPS heptosyltransferase
LPVLSALRQRFPAAEITWIINRAYEPLLRGHPDLTETLPFDRGAARRGWWRGASNFVAFLREIRRRQFDVVVDLQGLLRTGLMALASGARRIIGLRSAREGARYCYTDVLPDDLRRMHAVDRYWLVVEALGVGDLPQRFHVPLTGEERAWADQVLAGCPRPWIAVNLGTRWQTKRWPVAHFAELVGRAVSSSEGTVVLLGSQDEVGFGEEFCRRFLAGTNRPVQHPVNLIGLTDLRQLGAVLSRVDVMVSNDSGPLHLAVALGRPVVAPYTCTSPVRTGPYGQERGAVATQVPCAASYLRICARMDCMSELTPDRLWPALEVHLLQWLRRSA